MTGLLAASRKPVAPAYSSIIQGSRSYEHFSYHLDGGGPLTPATAKKYRLAARAASAVERAEKKTTSKPRAKKKCSRAIFPSSSLGRFPPGPIGDSEPRDHDRSPVSRTHTQIGIQMTDDGPMPTFFYPNALAMLSIRTPFTRLIPACLTNQPSGKMRQAR